SGAAAGTPSAARRAKVRDKGDSSGGRGRAQCTGLAPPWTRLARRASGREGRVAGFCALDLRAQVLRRILSCPHAASFSTPRDQRTVHTTRRSASASRKRSTASRIGGAYAAPATGL